MPVPPAHDPDTRARLLEVAGDVFAEQGFHRATVRAICQRAGANVAAVNYHFGDKLSLYRAVFARALSDSIERYPPDHGLAPGASPEERLFAFVHSFLLRLFAGGMPAWLMNLMMREMAEPTGVIESMVESVHRPMYERLRGIVRDLGGPGLAPEDVDRCAHSVVGQVTFYRHALPVLRALGQDAPQDERGIRRLAEHVTRFSVAGVRAAGGRAP